MLTPLLLGCVLHCLRNQNMLTLRIWLLSLPLLLLQTFLGNAASVTLGPDGMLWVLYRGGRVWDADSFDADFRYLFHDPIQTDIVVQMHPDTGAAARSNTIASSHIG
jgi:hypothetical protein